MTAINYYARRCIAWPLALVGLVCSFLSEGLIRSAAWLADVDPDDDEQSL